MTFIRVPYLEAISENLTNRGLQIAVAESCTGGLLAGSLTSIPGSSNWFCGGLIVYSNRIKTKVLGVKLETINRFGAVSEDVVKEMAFRCRELYSSDLSISITGIAGPGGGSILKPVGTIWIGLAWGHSFWTKKLSLTGNRQFIRERTIDLALKFVCTTIDKTRNNH